MRIIAAVGVLCILWGIIESHLFKVGRYVFDILPPGIPSISILQISDLHLRQRRKKMARFIRSIDETYDFVFATGDLLGGPESVELCAELLNTLDAKMGRYFVLGSSDYYAPRIKNYIDYFLKRRKHGTRRNPTGEFREKLAQQGWLELTNAQILGNVDGLTFQITGLDDPYLHRDDRSILHRDPTVDLAICVVHAPDPYLDASAAGYDLMISGHTHGGQVRLPFIGAVVTNSAIPRAIARGASKVGQMWLFITPGLGTGKYAPFRFMCRPEVSVLELVARED